MVHDEQVADLAQALSTGFNLSNRTLPDGTKVQVELLQESGIKAAKRIAAGELKTDAWLARSSALVNYTNTHLSNLGPNQTDCKQLFATPIIVATTEQNKLSFNSVDQSFSWKEFFGSKFESPGSNSLTSGFFYHGSPLDSATGLESLVELSYLSAPSKTNSLDLDTLRADATQKRLKSFEAFVSAYPLSDSDFLSKISLNSTARAQFALTTEQQLALFNKSRRSGAKLVALYPSEGSYWQDYNICLSDADWVNAAKKAALKMWFDFLGTDRAQLSAKLYGFRPSASQIGDVDPLTAKFGVNLALPSVSFLPAPGDVTEFLLDSWSQIMRPSATVLVMDTSGTMENALTYGQEQFRNWVAASANRDMKGLISFSSDVAVNVPLTSNPKEFIQGLDQLSSKGGSAIYDALKRGFETLQDRSLDGFRKSLVLYTDGGDNNSQVSLELLCDIAHQRSIASDINLFIVAIQRENSQYNDLKRIAKEAGGLYIESALIDMQETLQMVFRNL